MTPQINKIAHPCPSCASPHLSIFYEIKRVPIHSVILLPTREEALNYPTGDMRLGFCWECGFITNVDFDANLHEYSSRYEETQGYSSTFTAFHRRLAEYLIEKYDLHQKTVIEIGCGKGEFLRLLCELGDNSGVGFDPAYVPGRVTSDRVTFIKDFYSEKYANYTADFICCKMTLEHIQDVAEFVGTVRRSIGDNKETVVFFQVPDVRRILQEIAFWDIYYEHCSYFSLGSLSRLFRKSGFDVTDLWVDYADQYLMIEARLDHDQPRRRLKAEDDLEILVKDLNVFATEQLTKRQKWLSDLYAYMEDGCKVTLWGGGSKAVAFLTTLQISTEMIQYVVDINPYKAGTYLAGTGHEIVAPEFLKSYKPDVVIAMNPIYHAEIQQNLHELGVQAKLISV
jgi:SAM-dependent methyltransferase